MRIDTLSDDGMPTTDRNHKNSIATHSAAEVIEIAPSQSSGVNRIMLKW